MSNEQSITISGRVIAEPELRFTPSGAAVVNFTVAFNPRKFDKQTNEWKEGTAQFWRCAAWNMGKLAMAENIAGTIRKGDNVILTGTLEAREFEKDGQKRTALEIRVEHMGKDVRFHGEPTNAEPEFAAAGGWGQNDPSGAPF